MRLIDADAFKNYIRGALDDVKHLYKDNGAWAKEITDSFCMDIDEQPTVEAEPHWIPCSVRLPDEGQKCLVSNKGFVGINTYIGHGNPYNWKWYVKDYEAWMPLPEPYRGGETE